MEQTRVDIAIVGGGVAGRGAALALRHHLGAEAALSLIDIDAPLPGLSRAYAIAPDVAELLQTWSVWPRLAGRSEAVRAMSITDGRPDDPVRIERLRLGDGAGPLAHIVAERDLIEAMEAALRADSGLMRIAARVADHRVEAAGVVLVTDDGRRHRAQLVVAADGAASPLRERAGIPVLRSDYGQSGLVATFGHEVDHGGIAVQHFLPGGPFALLPMTGRRSSIVWTLPGAEAARVSCLEPATFLETIAPLFGHHLGALSLVAGPQHFPLRVQMARRFGAARLLLLGDAAHVVHPLAGQGMNLGLRDAEALAGAVASAMRLGLDPGDATVLDAYQERRRPAATAMAAATDGLNRLFSSDSLVLRALRDFGLGIVDRTGPVKRAAVASARR